MPRLFNFIFKKYLLKIASLEREIREKEFLFRLGNKAAQQIVNGYVMVGSEYLPKNKNCVLAMESEHQAIAKALGIKCEKWRRELSDKQKKKTSQSNRVGALGRLAEKKAKNA